MSCSPELLFTVMPWPTVNGWGLAGARGIALAAPGQVSDPTDTERERALSPLAALRKGLSEWPGFSWGWKLGEPQQLLGILLGPACPGTRLKTFARRQPADSEPGAAGGDVRDHPCQPGATQGCTWRNPAGRAPARAQRSRETRVHTGRLCVDSPPGIIQKFPRPHGMESFFKNVTHSLQMISLHGL